MATTPRLDPSLWIDPAVFQKLAGKGGLLSAAEIGRSGVLPPPPKGYQYSYQFSNPAQPLQLKKDSSLWKNISKAALIGGGALATALTGGAASPLLAAAIGAGTGAGVGAIDAGWKGALLGGATGAATGGLLGGAGGAAGGAAGSTGASTAGTVARQGLTQAAKTALSNPRLYAQMAGQIVPGPAGTALSVVGGAGGGTMAGTTGWQGALSGILKDPNTYAALGTALGSTAKGQATERGQENVAAQARDRALADIYGTQQQAPVQLMQLLERALQDRAKLALEAPSARLNQIIRGSLLANMQPARITGGFSSNVRIPQISGGLSPAALSNAARVAGAEMQRQALSKLFSGQDVPAMPNFAGALVAPPQLSQYKGPGTMESVLSGAGIGLGALDAILKSRTQQQGTSRDQWSRSIPNLANKGMLPGGTMASTVPSDFSRYHTPPYFGR
jgi:hypothetical protein